MTDKELRRLKRGELLEILLEQQKKIDSLEAQLKEKDEQLESKRVKISNAGSIAEAAISMTNLFQEAEKAVEIYLENIQKNTEEQIGEE